MGKDLHFELLDNVSDCFFALDNQLVVTFWNKPAEKVLGKKANEVIGKPLFDSFPEARGTVFEKEYSQAIIDKQPRTFEAFYDAPPIDNWYEVRVYPGDDGISVYFHTITERKNESDQLLFQSQLLSAVNSAVIATDLDGIVTY